MACENAKKAALVNPKIILRHRLSGLEPDAIDVRVLMDGRRTVPPIRRNDQHLGGVGMFRLRIPLSIARREAAFMGLNPNLQEMQRSAG